MICCCGKKESKDPICQSCSMPMKKREDFGTEKDGKVSCDYCRYCYQKGSFTKPNVSQQEMINESSSIMKKMGMGKKEEEEMKKAIPKLKSWKKQ
jgi:hypothetical protein